MYGQVILQVLEEVGEVSLPGVEKFVVSEHFTQEKFNLNFEFHRYMSRKVEREVPSSTLIYGRAMQMCGDTMLILALGGGELVETKLFQLHHLLSLQPGGEPGDLLTDGTANVFCVRGYNDVLCIVDVRWAKSFWDICLYDTPGSGSWHPGFRVFSRRRTA